MFFCSVSFFLFSANRTHTQVGDTAGQADDVHSVSTQRPTPDLIGFGSALETIIIHTIDTNSHTHREVCALQRYNHRVIFSIARIIPDERCCQPLWPSTGSLFDFHSVSVGCCIVRQSLCWCIECANSVCSCVGHRSSGRAHTQTHTRRARSEYETVVASVTNECVGFAVDCQAKCVFKRSKRR